MLFKARPAALAFIAAGTLSLAACGGSSSDQPADGSPALVTEGTLTVCSDIPYVPFEYEENGAYTGFDMDLIREVAAGMDLDVEIRDTGFEGLASGTVLRAGQCDLGASAISITPERQEQLAFSDPYYDSLQSLLVPVDSTIAGIEDLDGKKLGVQQGTTGASYAQENVSGAEIISFASDGELFPAVQSGAVDAVLQDLPVNLGHTKEGEFQVVEKYETDESYGFAMTKENTALVEQVNEQLAALQDNGKYQEIYDKYFTE